MSLKSTWHSVDECVISPLRNSPEISPEDSISQVPSQNDSFKSKSSSTSSKRKREARIKAAVANLQAKQLAEQVKRENQVREEEFREETAQMELELKLEYRKREFELLRKKRESEKAVISAQNEAELAQLEHEIIGQEVTERNAEKNQNSKVSETITSLKPYLMNTDAESKDHFSNPCTELKPGMTSGYISQELKTSDHTPLQYDKQVVMSYANTPLNPVAKCLPPKVLEFYAPNIGGCTSTQPDPFSQGSEYTSQHIITPVSLGSDPQTNTVSSCHYVNFPQPLVGYSNIYAPPVTSVTWSTKPEIKYPERLSSQTPQDIPLSSRPTCVSTSPAVSNSFQAYFPHDPKFESPLNHSFPSSTPLWGPSSRSTSTPHSSRVKSNPLHRPVQVDPRGEPVDAFIDRLIDGQETVFAESLNSSLTDSGTALLRAQEQQRLPPLELFKFTGKPIEWPKFIERFRDQIHNKTTLTDSDRMSYLFQNLSGEAKKAIESLGVTGHSYPTALKTLKRQFGNPAVWHQPT